MTKSYAYIPSRPSMTFNLFWISILGALLGFLTAEGQHSLMISYAGIGAIVFASLSFISIKLNFSRNLTAIFCGVVLFFPALFFTGLAYAIVVGIFGCILGSMSLWLADGSYRLNQPPYATSGEVLWFYSFRFICGLIFLFLIAPILIVFPLSFNKEPYFSFTEGMLAFNSEAFSLRWYIDILHNGMIKPEAIEGWWSDLWINSQWIRSIKNSFIIGIFATLLATGLGTLAAIGLSRSEMPFRRPIMALLISPMIVPLVIIASGMFFFFSDIGIAKTYLGVIVAHAILGTPYVIITVTATLVGFDQSLTRAAASLGANPFRTFFKVQMPLILPGVVSGALFAFITSFDEVVVVLQVADVRQRTIPRQMFSGIREQISPTILAVATILVILSILLLTIVELLRRRSERLRGVTPL
ncbi:MAG: ABC transporter permease [Paracoccaceae bacterium]|nr:ABC transporter permease [Paracoccaceae bacterium]